MTKDELEKIWRCKPLQFEGHVACWNDNGFARPGAALMTVPGESAYKFRALIKKINRQREKDGALA